MNHKRPRQIKFNTYKKEQLAVKKLAEMFKTSMSGLPLVVWGNGGFGPTSRGHESAPNKGLRDKLSQYLPIVIESEHRSTKLSCCHHTPTVSRNKKQQKRDTVKMCVFCKTLLGRDTNAAHNIADIFEHNFRTGSLPGWLSTKKQQLEAVIGNLK